jgi:hypothetical protein
VLTMLGVPTERAGLRLQCVAPLQQIGMSLAMSHPSPHDQPPQHYPAPPPPHTHTCTHTHAHKNAPNELVGMPPRTLVSLS